MGKAQPLLGDGDEHVDADGDPDLCLHSVGRSAEEGLDSEVLFDPFEEQFHLPAALVKVRYGECRKCEVVGEKYVSDLVLGIVEAYPTKRNRIQVSGLGSS
jgi:hypothetical protein|tara:strand:- start:6 stop:308 length:303 start_codon:yes stop_codon:yes gene_type:complete